MRIYLVQHGDAVDKSVDPDRPLSSRGKQEVEWIASVLARAGASPERILHSGKNRARQTAELFDKALRASAGMEEARGIAPLDSVADFAERLPALGGEAMICGHQPFMGRLVSHLLAGNADLPLVEYLPGSVAGLRRTPEEGWVLCWFVRPELCYTND